MKLESSRTSMWAGQSGQLWCQQTITSQPVTPLALQDHNHPVRYRNVWIRELK
jgi:hypothetical protein